MKRETSNVLVAFLAGAAAGSVVALLLAPASGVETRKRIGDTLKKAKDRTLDELESAKEFAAIQKDAIKEAYAEGKGAYQKAVKKTAET